MDLKDSIVKKDTEQNDEKETIFRKVRILKNTVMDGQKDYKVFSFLWIITLRSLRPQSRPYSSCIAVLSQPAYHTHWLKN